MTFAQQHTDGHAMPLSVEYSSRALRTRAYVVMSRALGGNVALFGSVFGDIAAWRTAIPDGPTSAPRARVGLSLGLRLGL